MGQESILKREVFRQGFHIFVGFLAVALLFIFGRTAFFAVVFAIVIIGTVMINLRIRGYVFQPVAMFENLFERNNVPFPGWGSACYATGVLMLIAFLRRPEQIAAGILVLAVGDGVSTITGLLVKFPHHLPYNRHKTLEGTVAFFISSLPAYLFIGPMSIPVAFAGAITESLPVGIDDNLLIPISTIVVVMAFGS